MGELPVEHCRQPVGVDEQVPEPEVAVDDDCGMGRWTVGVQPPEREFERGTDVVELAPTLAVARERIAAGQALDSFDGDALEAGEELAALARQPRSRDGERVVALDPSGERLAGDS